MNVKTLMISMIIVIFFFQTTLAVIQASSDLFAYTQTESGLYGAGAGQLVRYDLSGTLNQTMEIPIMKVAGIATFGENTLLIGNGEDNTVISYDLASTSATQFLDLKAVNPGSYVMGDLLQSGELVSIASDGTSLYAGIAAGYSSSIFRIDPSTETILSHSWAPGPNPSAMAYHDGNLYVIDGMNHKLWKIPENLMDKAVSLSPADPSVMGIASSAAGLVSLRQENGRVLSESVLGPSSTIRKNVSLTPIVKAFTPVMKNATLLSPATSTSKITAEIDPAVIAELARAEKKVAVLICGDIAESGYDEFWGDTIWLYKTLRNLDYAPEDIYVLYGNGIDYSCENPYYQSSETITDFSATTSNIDLVFDGLKDGDATHGISQIPLGSSLFVWTFDHGAGVDPAYLCLMDGWMDESHFADRFKDIPAEKKAVFMQQCRSGGFIDSLASPDTFISTACTASENAAPSPTHYETYDGVNYHHGEYNYHLITAISGSNPSGVSVQADKNSNQQLTALEAHEWIASHDSVTSETPQMSDSGTIGDTFIIRDSSGKTPILPELNVMKAEIKRPEPDPIYQQTGQEINVGRIAGNIA